MALNSNYVFDNHIRTASNSDAREACLTFAQSEAPPSNPIFLHGPTGVGKTHLLYAIGNLVMQRKPADKVILVSAETMRNDLYDSVNLGQMEQFRDRYTSVDLLLVDEMQILFGRQKTQEELSRVFASLIAGGGRLALASSQRPDAISSVSDVVRSKLKNCLLLPLKPPSEQELELILSKKYAAAQPPVPKRIIRMAVQQEMGADIRRAEGLVKQMVFADSQA